MAEILKSKRKEICMHALGWREMEVGTWLVGWLREMEVGLVAGWTGGWLASWAGWLALSSQYILSLYI
jgi:IS1 family transposase